MFISDFAIKRPVVTTVTMLALVVFGLFALFSLDTDEFPEVEAPFIFISVPYPGASPDIVEREVVDPIEEAVAGISGVDQIQSQALDGFASIQVIFVYGIDPKAAAQDIRDAVSQIRGDLPQEMEEPILARFDPNDQPIVSLSLCQQHADAGGAHADRGPRHHPRVARHPRRGRGAGGRRGGARAERGGGPLAAAGGRALHPPGGRGAADAEPGRPRGPAELAAGRADHPPARPAGVARRSSRSWSSPRPTGCRCGWAKWPRSVTGRRSRARWRCSTASPPWASTS